MEEYLNLLLEQIRCKKARPYIAEEMKGHIEEQILENIKSGMSKEEAEKEAICDMGSPIETGILLDKIHRPQMAWELIGIITIMSIIGIGIHFLIGSNVIESSRFTLHTMIGLGMMFLVYYIDYSMIARYSKILAFMLNGFYLWILFYGEKVNGTIFNMNFAGFHISLFSVMLLYIPLYGAIIYQYYGTGYNGIIKSIAWMLIPIFITRALPSFSLTVIFTISMTAILTIAVCKKWFAVSKKKVIAWLWGIVLCIPCLGIVVIYKLRLLSDYYMERLSNILFSGGEKSYITKLLSSYLANSSIIGGGKEKIIGILPDFNTSYIIIYLIQQYGILMGIMVCCVLAVLIIKIFSICFKQKNQLGMIMGYGCGMVLLMNFMINILENFRLLPLSQTFLPFVSAGGSDLIVCYMLIGIILSIYRYKNIYPIHMDKIQNQLFSE